MTVARIVGALAVLLPLMIDAPRADAPVEPGETELEFSDWDGPPIDVRIYLPTGFTSSTPIVIVMHGASRDAARYFGDWKTQAETRGFIVVVPEFSKARFPGSAHYNLGHVFDPQTGARRAENRWTFSAIEPLFDKVAAFAGSKQTGYTIFGHSAGAQFVHRFLYYKPGARVRRAIVANAGWYTMPDFGVDYPYGLSNSGVAESTLATVLQRDIVILLGNGDIDENAEQFRKTPEAELQGAHRFARGQTMYRVAKARAARLGVEFNWKLQTVAGAGHVNAQMTPAAAVLIEQN